MLIRLFPGPGAPNTLRELKKGRSPRRYSGVPKDSQRGNGMRLARWIATLALAMLVMTAGTASATTPISGFQLQTAAEGFDQALSFDWTPDGRMLVVQK